ncbi:LysE family transporter [Aquimarina rhabdastrellae]
MESLYLFLGIVAAAIGAIPLGAVNIAVINTTLNEGIKNTPKLITAAGIAEILLALISLYFSMLLLPFFHNNSWIQYFIIILFLCAGVFFLLKKTKKNNTLHHENPKLQFKMLTGFSLGILNPPVIIYWMLAISYLNEQTITLNHNLPLFNLMLFITGVFIGKVTTLFAFAKVSSRLKKNTNSFSEKTPKIIGFALLIVAIVQGLKIAIA